MAGTASQFEGRARNGKPAQATSAEVLRELLEALPPHSLEAEMSLLGSLILDPRSVAEVLTTAPGPELFYREGHATIYKAILSLYDQHEGWDAIQLLELLRDQGQLDEIGGVAYLKQLAECVPSAVNAPHYARLVAAKHRLRALIDSAWRIIYDAHNVGQLGPDGVASLLDRAEAEIFEIAHEKNIRDVESIAKILQDEIDRLEAQEGKGITGIATGYADLDNILSGLQPGEMLILAARPSMGKTAFALNLAEQVAFGGATPWSPPLGKPAATAIFSLEMSRGSLAQRLISARSGIDLHHLRTGQMGMEEWGRLNAACGELHEAPLYIDDTPALTILQLRARARRMVSQFGVKVIVIDYLQLLTAPNASRESRQVEVATISRGIKALARELNVPIVCLAQLNRGTEQREGNRPRMADLRESGSIEQDADVVMLLHREAYYHRGDPEWLADPENEGKENLAELIIAKQRNGPTGIVNLTWDSKTTRFKSHDAHHQVAEYAGHHGGGGNGFDGYSSPSHAAGAAPEVRVRAAPAEYRGFAPGGGIGPVADFRDGGGPAAADEDDASDVPF
ncbi:MAG TPA: replicative DNA helicase [Phycisphaerales bacterium]|nr:replicative DNA helicase [Phycisphaerales bacterium]